MLDQRMVSRLFVVVLSMLLLAGCSSGGSGGGAEVVQENNKNLPTTPPPQTPPGGSVTLQLLTAPVVINASNAFEVLANYETFLVNTQGFADPFAAAVSSASALSVPATSVVATSNPIVSALAGVTIELDKGIPFTLGTPDTGTIQCAAGGSKQVTVTEQGAATTIETRYSDCQESDQLLLNGGLIKTYVFSTVGSGLLSRLETLFDAFVVVAPATQNTLAGVVSVDFAGDLPLETSTKTIAMDLTVTDNLRQRMSGAQGLVITLPLFKAFGQDAGFEYFASGSFSDSEHGQVTVTGDGGSVALSGATLPEAVSATRILLQRDPDQDQRLVQVDVDGDSKFDSLARIDWTGDLNLDVNGSVPVLVVEGAEPQKLGTSIDVDVSKSFDLDGNLVTLTWKILSAPAGITVVSPGTKDDDPLTTVSVRNNLTFANSGQLMFKGPVPGIYVLEVTASDGLFTNRKQISVDVFFPLISSLVNPGPVNWGDNLSGVALSVGLDDNADGVDDEKDTSDVNALALQYSLDYGPEGLQIDVKTGVITWKARDFHFNQPMTFDFKVRARLGAQSEVAEGQIAVTPPPFVAPLSQNLGKVFKILPEGSGLNQRLNFLYETAGVLKIKNTDSKLAASIDSPDLGGAGVLSQNFCRGVFTHAPSTNTANTEPQEAVFMVQREVQVLDNKGDPAVDTDKNPILTTLTELGLWDGVAAGNVTIQPVTLTQETAAPKAFPELVGCGRASDTPGDDVVIFNGDAIEAWDLSVPSEGTVAAAAARVWQLPLNNARAQTRALVFKVSPIAAFPSLMLYDKVFDASGQLRGTLSAFPSGSAGLATTPLFVSNVLGDRVPTGMYQLASDTTLSNKLVITASTTDGNTEIFVFNENLVLQRRFEVSGEVRQIVAHPASGRVNWVLAVKEVAGGVESWYYRGLDVAAERVIWEAPTSDPVNSMVSAAIQESAAVGAPIDLVLEVGTDTEAKVLR